MDLIFQVKIEVESSFSDVQVLFLDDDLGPLYELIDIEELPEELGGPRPPMDSAYTLSLLEGDNKGSEV